VKVKYSPAQADEFDPKFLNIWFSVPKISREKLPGCARKTPKWFLLSIFSFRHRKVGGKLLTAYFLLIFCS